MFNYWAAMGQLDEKVYIDLDIKNKKEKGENVVQSAGQPIV